MNIETTFTDHRSRPFRFMGAIAAILAALCLALPAVSSAEDNFVESWDAGVYDQSGTFDPRAGAHPFSARTDIGVKVRGITAVEYVRTVKVETPAGLVINPQAVPTCSRAEFFWRTDADQVCPPQTQVGTVALPGVYGSPFDVFNMEPRRGVPAEFGFLASAVPVFVQGQVSADGRIFAFSPDNGFGNNVRGIDFTFFGVPADPAHGTGSSAQRKALVTTPTSCVGPVNTILDINSWQDPVFEHYVSPTPVGGAGCVNLPFNPSTDLSATSSEAGAPTGLDFLLEVPQSDNPDGRATAHVKDVEVQLPEGMRVNASAADGLAGCTPAQVDLNSTDPVGCPDGSKIGSVQVETPLLEEKIGGAVYLAQPYDNPFGSLLGLYVVAENVERGIRLKIPGRVDIDPVTGKLTAKFEDNPQLPYGSLRVSFNGGPRAPLMLPERCGNYEVVTRVSPWSAADTENPTEAEIVTDSSTLVVDQGCGATGFSPGFSAGSVSGLAADSSPFVLNANRDDGDDEFRTLENIKLPEGLLGYISRVETCEAGAAALGTCAESSRVGRVVNSVGAGPRPAWLPQPGKDPTGVFLAGPYRGAPYSLSILVPAQAGPFDLGRVVVRTPLHVNERTAQITTGVAESLVYNRHGALTQRVEGGLPTMLEGIPLEIRDIRVLADRPGFMLNPTSCRAQSVVSDLVSVGGLRAAGSSRFGLRGCNALGFAPRFSARILNRGRRSTVRSWHPRTRFTVVPRKGDANIGGARVALPSSIILDQANIGTTCTRAQMAAEDCPRKSVVGFARAFSPVLNRPVQGPVYLAANGGVRPLPDLTAVLDGEVRLVLQGEIATQRRRGKARLQNTFRVVPDAPVSRFTLTMRGGKRRGLLVNSTDLCRSSERLNATFTGQNGKRHRVKRRVGLRFKGCKKARRKIARRKAARKQAARKSVTHRSSRT